MAQDFALETDSSPRATETWWASRRLRYNIGLLVAGPLGLVSMLWPSPGALIFVLPAIGRLRFSQPFSKGSLIWWWSAWQISATTWDRGQSGWFVPQT